MEEEVKEKPIETREEFVVYDKPDWKKPIGKNRLTNRFMSYEEWRKKQGNLKDKILNKETMDKFVNTTKSVLNHMIGNPLGNDEDSSRFFHNIESLLTIKSEMNYSLFCVSYKPVSAINHRGESYYLTNVMPQPGLYEPGIYLQISGTYRDPTTNNLYPKRDQSLFPLPQKEKPTIIVPLGLILFFDEADKEKFLLIHDKESVKEVINDYIIGGSGRTPGLSNNLFAISKEDREYYTIVEKNIQVIPNIRFENFYYHCPINMRKDIEEALENNEDVLVNINKNTHYSLLFTKDNFENNKYKRSLFNYKIIRINKEKREEADSIFIPELNLLIFKNEHVALEALKDGVDSNIEKMIFNHVVEALEEEYKEKIKNHQEKKNYNKAFLNFFFFGAGVGIIFDSQGKKIIKIIKDKIKKKTEEKTKKEGEKILGCFISKQIGKICPIFSIGFAIYIFYDKYLKKDNSLGNRFVNYSKK